MSSPLGELNAPLTRADLVEYARRLGEPSPTPTDAFRFFSLASRVAPLLGDGDGAQQEFAYKVKFAANLALPPGAPADLAEMAARRGAGNFSPPQLADMLERLLAPVLARQAARGAPPPSPFAGAHITAPVFLAAVPCATCGAAAGAGGAPLSRCGTCLAAVYCGRACQKKDWPAHKAVCKRVHE